MPSIAEAKEAADRGAVQQSRLMYETILQENPHSEEAWLGLADVLTEAEDKKICYNNILKINRKSKAAKDGLRSLEPQHDPLRAAFDIDTASENEFEQAPAEEEPANVAEPTVQTAAQKRKKKKKSSASTPSTASESDTPTPILVAFGLALSVVVFAIGSGIVYFVLSSIPRF